jgi:hypothetical protein
MTPSIHLLSELYLDPDTTLDFFIVFSRFEFALKVAGYARLNNRHDYVEPDWPQWANKHATPFERWYRSVDPAHFPTQSDSPAGDNPFTKLDLQQRDALHRAVTYMNERPPKVQTLRVNNQGHSTLVFRDNQRLKHLDLLNRLVACVKTVRNNLFHGGKYNSANPFGDDPHRNQQLIRHSLVILHAFLLVDDQLRDHFEPPILRAMYNRVALLAAG